MCTPTNVCACIPILACMHARIAIQEGKPDLKTAKKRATKKEAYEFASMCM